MTFQEQPLGDPILMPGGGGREVRPERRIVKRDLTGTPAPTYMRDVDPAR